MLSIFRSKARWVEEGEKPTKYFLHMERKNFNKKVITELKVTEGTNIVDEEKLSEEIKLFYKYLFTSTNHITDETFQEFTKKTPIKIHKLSDEENNQIEGKLTLEECLKALKSMANGKLPGEDAFTVEFYKCFFDSLGHDLLNCFY